MTRRYIYLGLALLWIATTAQAPPAAPTAAVVTGPPAAPVKLRLAADVTPPTVRNTTPLNPDGTLPLRGPITFQFSEPVILPDGSVTLTSPGK